MTIVPATGATLNRILDDSFPVWGEGLTRDAYGKWNAAQRQTFWGREHLDRIALVDGGRVLSSLKRYRFGARLDGRAVLVLGIAAVFTPPEARGQGHAARLIEQVLADETARGTGAALLFSEIGEAYYERFGFVPVPLATLTVGVDVTRGGSPAMLVRAGDETDLASIAEMGRLRAASARFALDRDVHLIRFEMARRRLFAGLGPPGLRQLEFHVAEEGHHAVAYVVLSVEGSGWTIEECGDRDPTGARLGAMLQVLLAREPSHAPPLIEGWLPDGFLPPQLSIVARQPAAARMMIRPLTATIDPPLAASDVIYWHADAF